MLQSGGTMKAVCVAVVRQSRAACRGSCLTFCAQVGKQNNPLYIQTFGQEDELKFHFIVHTSLDVVEEKLAKYESLARLSRVSHAAL
jgi:hypothetical protein